MLAAALVIGCGRRAETVEEEPLAATTGTTVETALAGGQTHRYRLELPAESFADLAVEQHGIDVWVDLFAPDGTRWRRVDSPNGTQGLEPLPFVTSAAGSYPLEIGSLEPAALPGRYTLSLRELRPATVHDRDRSAAEDVLAKAEQLRWQGGEERLHAALGAYRQAQTLLGAVGEPGRQADALYGEAQTHANLGDGANAVALYEQALVLYRSAGERPKIANLLTELGNAARLRGQPRAAITYYREALPLQHALGERGSEAATLNNLGEALAWLREVEPALDCFEQALALWRQLGRKSDEGMTLSSLGALHLYLGDDAVAREYFAAARALLETAGSRRAYAMTLARIGTARADAGDAGGILDLETALGLHRELGDRREQAAAWSELGLAYRRQGQLESARRAYREALAGFRAVEDPWAEAVVTANLGRVETGLGEIPVALELFSQALPILRAIGDRNGSSLALYGLARARLAGGDPEGARGAIDEALALVETLRTEPARSELRGAFFAERQDLYALAIDLRMGAGRTEPSAGEVEAALALAETARARVLLDMLSSPEPHRRALADLRPLGAAEIRALPDLDTLVLEYALGEERSYLWAVTPEGVRAHVLPSRATLETAARRAHGLLAKSRERTAAGRTELALAELGRTLLDPVADLLAGKRLVVIPDGALCYLPFAALPTPGGGPPLVESSEVVSLPSASVLAALRRALAPPAQTGTVAVFTDPTAGPAGAWALLPFAQQEAEAILALVPAGEGVRAGGLGGDLDLARWRILHFATHAVLDTEHPERSRLVVPRQDAAGQPRPGFLYGAEIRELRLGAELVVLSGCETALGRELRGEGLVGLARSFMAAGAEKLLVSLWRVDDRSTAELMRRFYQGLLRDGLTPAAALRRAQTDLRRQPGRQAPYDWAGFVLIGDFR